MKQSRPFRTAFLVCVAVWAYAETAQAGVIAIPPSGPARIASADAVIIGKVDGLEPEDVKIGNTTYRIAVVRITEGLKGIKSEKTLRVGFIPIEKPKPMVIVSGARPIQLEVGTEGLFILAKLDKQTVYTIRGVVGYYISSNNNKDFEKEVQSARAALKVLENPQAALKAKGAEDRLLAAAVLVEKYRSFRGPNAKEEPIDAGESKQILEVIAGADWTAPQDFRSLRPNPVRLFQQLGVTKTDGFAPPAGATYQAAVQTWVRENAEKYRIRRFVVDEKK